ncbi:hypothetical protein [Nitrospira sp. Kam-Ns4a]
MLALPEVDRGQRKRLADICEKLGAALKGILTDGLVWQSLVIGGLGFMLLAVSIQLSRED